MSVRVLSVGKPIGGDYKALVNEYEKRLTKQFEIDWQFIPPSGRDKESARRAESDSLRSKLTASDFIVLCDERGVELTTEAFAAKLESWSVSGRQVTLIIGGAYGVDDELRAQADMVWSLSKLVFPHEVVRLLIAEQLYRAQCVLSSHPYHHL